MACGGASCWAGRGGSRFAFRCLQAVILSDNESAAMGRAVAAILEAYNARLETGDADDVATRESLAAAIGSASELQLWSCE